MRIATWEPIYGRIRREFGFDRFADELARDRLAAELTPFSIERLDVTGLTVAVAGSGPSLESDSSWADHADAVFAASDAGVRLDDLGIEPDLVVTDLDGDPDGTIELARRGVPTAIHAHGDNVGLIDQYVRAFPSAGTLGTTQIVPVDPLVNVGGFTDGDRAAFLADALGADRLVFPGWDLEDRTVGPAKRRKLLWAERLLHWLERQRDERFDLLDGRRHRIDLRRLTG